MKNPTMNAGAEDIVSLIDSAPPSLRRNVIISICFAIVAIEGFDAAIIGFIAPQIAVHFASSPSKISSAIAAGMFGLLLGYLTAGTLADKRGRKPVLVIGATLFALTSVVCAFSTSLTQLIVWRFLTGVGIGLAMPAIGALLAELLPARRRASALSAVFCGFLFGSALAGLLTGHLIDVIGWEGLFLIGGAAPLVLIPAVIWLVPESPRYLAQLGAAPDAILRALAKLGLYPLTDVPFRASIPEPARRQGSVVYLFSPQFRTTTLLLWVLMFLILGSFYVIASWLPTLIRDAGVSVAIASRTASLFQFGGLAGAVTGVFAIRRMAPLKFVLIALVLGAVTPQLISMPASTTRYAMTVFCSGFLISGPIVVLNAVAAMVYPTEVRSVGAGWASGIGRIGSLVGAGSIGLLMKSGFALSQLIAMGSATVLLCAVVVAVLSRSLRESGV